MVDYNAVAKKVRSGFGKGGLLMTIRRITRGTYDPAAGTYSGDTTTDYSITGIIQSRRMYVSDVVGERFNGELVLTDDQFVLVAASGLAITPRAGDLLIINGTIFTVATMIPVRPGGINLFYRVLARK